jgi:hypothetical protein
MTRGFEELFRDLYGIRLDHARELINDLAPLTRRDDWWTTEGPYVILGEWLRRDPRS